MEPNLGKHIDYINQKIINLAQSKKGLYIPTEEVVFYSWQRIIRNLKHIENEQKENYFVSEVESLVKFTKERSRKPMDVSLGRILKVLEMEMAFNDLSLKDNQSYVAPHNRNVALYAAAVATAASQLSMIKKDEIDQVYLAASVHDVGKLAIPSQILKKPAKLDKDEFEEIKKHPTLGRDIVYSINEIFRTAVDAAIPLAIKSHHEKFFGGGYPQGLSGDNIPLYARIITICDCFDAMTSGRPYQQEKKLFEVLQEIRRNERGQFDPELAQIALEPLSRMYPKVRKIS